MKMQIHMIRHGHTEGNLRRCFYGGVDIPLTEIGKERLKKQREESVYPRPDTDNYFTTGLIRTEQTFEILYDDRPHKVVEELREVRFGQLEMKTKDEITAIMGNEEWYTKASEGWAKYGGDSVEGFMSRIAKGFKKVVKAVEESDAKDKEAVVVCHGGTISGIMASTFNEPGDMGIYNWVPEPGRGYTIIVEDGKIVDYKPL